MYHPYTIFTTQIISQYWKHQTQVVDGLSKKGITARILKIVASMCSNIGKDYAVVISMEFRFGKVSSR
jgi:hypothetical protein